QRASQESRACTTNGSARGFSLRSNHDLTLFVRGNKNDFNDALAIAEASRTPEMRPVAVKTTEQQSIQALHRLRRSAAGDRTALSNQVRELLAEFGLVMNKGIT
ncbi:MAG TPA: transposase, partial [Leucothrix mucor]|nr:transposase [Leucothrix mucor]